MTSARSEQPRLTSGASGPSALVVRTLWLAALALTACSDDPNGAETVPEAPASETVPEVTATETAPTLPLCSESLKGDDADSEVEASLVLPPCFGSAAGCDHRIHSAIVSLDARVADDTWSLTVVSGDLLLPALWQDGAALNELAPGDRIAVSGAQTCMPYSGCKSFVVVRNADDDSLIYAHFDDAPDNLVTFGWLTGLYIAAEPRCERHSRECSEGETDTWFRLTVAERGSVALLDPYRHAPLTVDTHTYTAWLGSAYARAAEGPPISGACVDAGSLYWTGRATLTISR